MVIIINFTIVNLRQNNIIRLYDENHKVFFLWTKRPLKKEKKKVKIKEEEEQLFYKSQGVFDRKLANLTQN